MSDQTKLPPIIEPWRVGLIVLAVAAAMVFAHVITPTPAEAVGDLPVEHRAS